MTKTCVFALCIGIFSVEQMFAIEPSSSIVNKVSQYTSAINKYQSHFKACGKDQMADCYPESQALHLYNQWDEIDSALKSKKLEGNSFPATFGMLIKLVSNRVKFVGQAMVSEAKIRKRCIDMVNNPSKNYFSDMPAVELGQHEILNVCKEEVAYLKKTISQNYDKARKGMALGYPTSEIGRVKKYIYRDEVLVPNRVRHPFWGGQKQAKLTNGEQRVLASEFREELSGQLGFPLADLKYKRSDQDSRATEIVHLKIRPKYRVQYQEAMMAAPILLYLNKENPSSIELKSALSAMQAHAQAIADENFSLDELFGYGPIIEDLLKNNPEYCEAAEAWALAKKRRDKQKGYQDIAIAGGLFIGCAAGSVITMGMAAAVCFAAGGALAGNALVNSQRSFQLEKNKAFSNALGSELVDNFDSLTQAQKRYATEAIMFPLSAIGGRQAGLAIKGISTKARAKVTFKGPLLDTQRRKVRDIFMTPEFKGIRDQFNKASPVEQKEIIDILSELSPATRDFYKDLIANMPKSKRPDLAGFEKMIRIELAKQKATPTNTNRLIYTEPTSEYELVARNNEIVNELGNRGVVFEQDFTPGRTRFQFYAENNMVIYNRSRDASTDPFYGYFLKIKSVPSSKIKNPDHNTAAMEHPEFQTYLKKIRAAGEDVYVDTSLEYTDTLAFFRPNVGVVLNPKSTWKEFVHEYQHFEFHKYMTPHFDKAVSEVATGKRLKKVLPESSVKALGHQRILEIERLMKNPGRNEVGIDEALSTQAELRLFRFNKMDISAVESRMVGLRIQKRNYENMKTSLTVKQEQDLDKINRELRRQQKLYKLIEKVSQGMSKGKVQVAQRVGDLRRRLTKSDGSPATMATTYIGAATLGIILYDKSGNMIYYDPNTKTWIQSASN